MKIKLGRYETQLLAYAQLRNTRTVRIGALTGPLHLSAKQERELLSRMARAGIIARVQRGVYLVPPRLPLGGKWSPGEALALTALMEEVQGKYQICGPNAFNRYGFDEQIPNRVYAYNNRISGERTVGSVALSLIKVADTRLGSTEEFDTPEGVKAVYASRARTLVDAVYDWSRFNSLPRGYDWVRKELSAKRIPAAELVTVTLQYGDKGTIRRMGVLLELEGVDAAQLRKLERALPPSTGLIPWIPGSPKRGTINRRWGVVVNDTVQGAHD
jgi:predicted transcriptional regulator of viral defense system